MELDITKESERFKEHLEIEDNSHIIFSGIFGIGKTYFLEKFFKENANSKYEVFKISPVNYSISASDDIINYIKYDIAFQLLAKNIEFEKIDFSSLLTSQFYLQEHYVDIIASFAKYATGINKPFIEVFDELIKLINQIKKHNQDSLIDEKKDLVDFLKCISNNNTSIYEEDNITQLIARLITQLKTEKEIVLIIDDLDRMDPEHIFRILNVFACHFNIGNYEGNKFDVDKIILVCDINNIRNIFHAKYGQNIDFSGYIDKFYSTEIYKYDNKQIIRSSIKKILFNINTPAQYKSIFNLADDRTSLSIYIIDFIDLLISKDVLNLRSLLKFNQKEYNLTFYSGKLDNRKIDNYDYRFILVFDFITSLLGSIENLSSAIDKLSALSSYQFYNTSDLFRLSDLIALIDIRKHKGQDNREFIYQNHTLDIKIKYNLKLYTLGSGGVSTDISSVTTFDGFDKKHIDYLDLIKEAFKIYLQISENKTI